MDSLLTGGDDAALGGGGGGIARPGGPSGLEAAAETIALLEILASDDGGSGVPSGGDGDLSVRSCGGGGDNGGDGGGETAGADGSFEEEEAEAARLRSEIQGALAEAEAEKKRKQAAAVRPGWIGVGGPLESCDHSAVTSPPLWGPSLPTSCNHPIPVPPFSIISTDPTVYSLFLFPLFGRIVLLYRFRRRYASFWTSSRCRATRPLFSENASPPRSSRAPPSQTRCPPPPHTLHLFSLILRTHGATN